MMLWAASVSISYADIDHFLNADKIKEVGSFEMAEWKRRERPYSNPVEE